KQSGIHMVGVEDHYFAVALIPADTPIEPVIEATTLPVQDADAGAAAGSSAQAAGAAVKPITRVTVRVPTGRAYKLFSGSKDLELLSSLNLGLEGLTNFTPGMPLLGPLVGILARILYVSLRWIHGFLPNYGLGIIILTTIIKIIFYPITQRTMVKMRAV